MRKAVGLLIFVVAGFFALCSTCGCHVHLVTVELGSSKTHLEAEPPPDTPADGELQTADEIMKESIHGIFGESLKALAQP